jgi:hypothetical protein
VASPCLCYLTTTLSFFSTVPPSQQEFQRKDCAALHDDEGSSFRQRGMRDFFSSFVHRHLHVHTPLLRYHTVSVITWRQAEVSRLIVRPHHQMTVPPYQHDSMGSVVTSSSEKGNIVDVPKSAAHRELEINWLFSHSISTVFISLTLAASSLSINCLFFPRSSSCKSQHLYLLRPQLLSSNDPH